MKSKSSRRKKEKKNSIFKKNCGIKPFTCSLEKKKHFFTRAGRSLFLNIFTREGAYVVKRRGRRRAVRELCNNFSGPGEKGEHRPVWKPNTHTHTHVYKMRSRDSLYNCRLSPESLKSCNYTHTRIYVRIRMMMMMIIIIIGKKDGTVTCFV